MNTTEILTVLEAEKDEAAWKAAVTALPRLYQDVFLLPGYARAFSAVYQGKAYLFRYVQDNAQACQVILTRPVRGLPFYQGVRSGEEVYDAITPEYAGPAVACGLDQRQRFLKGFWKAFSSFCLGQKIIAEFGRLNPYYNTDTTMLAFLKAKQNRVIVSLDLTCPMPELWKKFSKGNKSSIKKAQREQVIVRRASVKESLNDFYRLYEMTMRRNQARKFYYFSLGYFEDLFRYLGDNCSLFTASLQDQVIAASIFLHQGNYIHYYFSGSDERFLSLCPNNLMVYEAIQWAQQQGYTQCNLGGGYHNNGDDSLFSFKSSFSETTIPFYTYRAIHDWKRYDALCQEYERFIGKRISAEEKGSGYFPLYRQSLSVP